MQTITPEEVQAWVAEGKVFELVDVREPFEHEDFNIGGQLIPLAGIIQQAALLRNDVPVVVYCRKGIRSQIAIQRLEAKFGFTNLINLTGGMEKWRIMINDQ